MNYSTPRLWLRIAILLLLIEGLSGCLGTRRETTQALLSATPPSYLIGEGMFKLCERDRDGRVACDSNRVKLDRQQSGVWKASVFEKSGQTDYIFRAVDLNNEYALVELFVAPKTNNDTGAFVYLIMHPDGDRTIDVYTEMKFPAPAVKALSKEFSALNPKYGSYGFEFERFTQGQLVDFASKVVSRSFWSKSLNSSSLVLVKDEPAR